MRLFRPCNVYEESWLLLGAIKILGLYPIKLFNTTCTNYIYVAALVIFYLLLYLRTWSYANTLFQDFLNVNETFIVRQIRYNFNIIFFPMITVLSMRQSSKIKKTLDQIDSVDKSMQFLNIEVDHTLCMKNDIVRITAVIFIVVMSNLMDYYGLLDNDRDYIYVFMWMVDRIPDFISAILICSFGVLINKIEYRFRQINVVLNIITKGKSLISISEISDANNIFRHKLIKVLRLELCKTVSLINEAYRFRLKILSMIYITYVCMYICVIYVHTNDSLYVVDILLTVTWGTVDLIKLVYLIHLYHTLTIEYV